MRVMRTTLFHMHTNPDAFGLDSIKPACDGEYITKERYFEISNAISNNTAYKYVRDDQKRECSEDVQEERVVPEPPSAIETGIDFPGFKN